MYALHTSWRAAVLRSNPLGHNPWGPAQVPHLQLAGALSNTTCTQTAWFSWPRAGEEVSVMRSQQAQLGLQASQTVLAALDQCWS
jgi:hypothetical protein